MLICGTKTGIFGTRKLKTYRGSKRELPAVIVGLGVMENGNAMMAHAGPVSAGYGVRMQEQRMNSLGAH
jgi:hypothetical protein